MVGTRNLFVPTSLEAIRVQMYYVQQHVKFRVKQVVTVKLPPLLRLHY